MNTKSYSTGEIIFNQGEESDYAYYILEGTVEVVVDTPTGEQVVAELDEKDFFGEMGIIVEAERTATVRAKTDLTLEVYGISEFENEILGNPERRNPYLVSLFEQLRSITGQIKAASASGKHPLSFEAKNTAPIPAVEAGGAVITELRLTTEEPLEEGGRPVDIVLKKFPFNIGRSSESTILVENDFYVEDERPYQVSRGHCCIEKRAGQWVVRDRFSNCGTVVNGIDIGSGEDSFTSVLKAGENELILGESSSRFKFKLTLS